jgi:hypothetical protein
VVTTPKIIHAIVERAKSHPEQREGIATELARVARTHENEVHRTAAINALVLLFLDSTFDFELLPHLQSIDESRVRQAMVEGELDGEFQEAVCRYVQDQSLPFRPAVHHIAGWLRGQMQFDRMHNEEECLLDSVIR